jgi:hypothetical protein
MHILVRKQYNTATHVARDEMNHSGGRVRLSANRKAWVAVTYSGYDNTRDCLFQILFIIVACSADVTVTAEISKN